MLSTCQLATSTLFGLNNSSCRFVRASMKCLTRVGMSDRTTMPSIPALVPMPTRPTMNDDVLKSGRLLNLLRLREVLLAWMAVSFKRWATIWSRVMLMNALLWLQRHGIMLKSFAEAGFIDDPGEKEKNDIRFSC